SNTNRKAYAFNLRRKADWLLRLQPIWNGAPMITASFHGTVYGPGKELDGLTDNLPGPRHVLFRGKDVAETEPHDHPAVQFCLHQVGLATGIDRFDDLGIATVCFSVAISS